MITVRPAGLGAPRRSGWLDARHSSSSAHYNDPGEPRRRAAGRTRWLVLLALLLTGVRAADAGVNLWTTHGSGGDDVFQQQRIAADRMLAAAERP